MLVVGTNPRAIRFARKVETKPQVGYRIVGFVDDAWDGFAEFRKAGYRLVSDFVISPTFSGNTRWMRWWSRCRCNRPMHGCRESWPGAGSKALSSGCSPIYSRQGIARSKAEEFEDQAVITVYGGYPENLQHLLKRALDVAISLAAIVVLAPLFLLTALLVKLTSSGPVLFVQERVGLNKRRFRLFKFRTMVRGRRRTDPQSSTPQRGQWPGVQAQE